jgi:hypothetical protein
MDMIVVVLLATSAKRAMIVKTLIAVLLEGLQYTRVSGLRYFARILATVTYSEPTKGYSVHTLYRHTQNSLDQYTLRLSFSAPPLRPYYRSFIEQSHLVKNGCNKGEKLIPKENSQSLLGRGRVFRYFRCGEGLVLYHITYENEFCRRWSHFALK